MSVASPPQLQVTIYPNAKEVPAASGQAGFWSEDGPSFQDVLDTINPLQHIPLISSTYRSLTGQTTSTGSKLAGDALFGGPIGFLTSLLDSILQSATGSDLAGNLIAAVEGKPVPAMHTVAEQSAHKNEPIFLNAHQREAYNAYVRTGALT